MRSKLIDRRFGIKELTEKGRVAGQAGVFGVQDACADVVAITAFRKIVPPKRPKHKDDENR